MYLPVRSRGSRQRGLSSAQRLGISGMPKRHEDGATDWGWSNSGALSAREPSNNSRRSITTREGYLTARGMGTDFERRPGTFGGKLAKNIPTQLELAHDADDVKWMLQAVDDIANSGAENPLKQFMQMPRRRGASEQEKEIRAKKAIIAHEVRLLEAARNGNLEVVKEKVQLKLNLECRDRRGRTPLSKAAMNGHLKTVEYLVGEKADVNSRDVDRVTPLMQAARWGHTNIVRTLAKAGAKVNALEREGNSAVHLAAFAGWFDTVECLVDELKADDGVKNFYKQKAEELARAHNHKRVAELLGEEQRRRKQLEENSNRLNEERIQRLKELGAEQLLEQGAFSPHLPLVTMDMESFQWLERNLMQRAGEVITHTEFAYEDPSKPKERMILPEETGQEKGFLGMPRKRNIPISLPHNLSPVGSRPPSPKFGLPSAQAAITVSLDRADVTVRRLNNTIESDIAQVLPHPTKLGDMKRDYVSFSDMQSSTEGAASEMMRQSILDRGVSFGRTELADMSLGRVEELEAVLNENPPAHPLAPATSGSTSRPHSQASSLLPAALYKNPSRVPSYGQPEARRMRRPSNPKVQFKRANSSKSMGDSQGSDVDVGRKDTEEERNVAPPNPFKGRYAGFDISVFHETSARSHRHREDFIRKISVHPYILRYLGKGIDSDGRSCILTELVAHDSLHNFIVKLLGTTKHHLHLHHKLAIAFQVCEAMKILSNGGVHHGCLSAHNVFVMSADLTTPGAIRVAVLGVGSDWSQRGKLPSCVLPEDPSENLFHPESFDVWCFGVLFWQLFGFDEVSQRRGNLMALPPIRNPSDLDSDDFEGDIRRVLGEAPPLARRFSSIGDRATRFTRPNDCPRDIFDLMSKCWLTSAENRPNFNELSVMIKEITLGRNFAVESLAGPGLTAPETQDMFMWASAMSGNKKDIVSSLLGLTKEKEHYKCVLCGFRKMIVELRPCGCKATCELCGEMLRIGSGGCPLCFSEISSMKRRKGEEKPNVKGNGVYDYNLR